MHTEACIKQQSRVFHGISRVRCSLRFCLLSGNQWQKQKCQRHFDSLRSFFSLGSFSEATALPITHLERVHSSPSVCAIIIVVSRTVFFDSRARVIMAAGKNLVEVCIIANRLILPVNPYLRPCPFASVCHSPFRMFDLCSHQWFESTLSSTPLIQRFYLSHRLFGALYR